MSPMVGQTDVKGKRGGREGSDEIVADGLSMPNRVVVTGIFQSVVSTAAAFLKIPYCRLATSTRVFS